MSFSQKHEGPPLQKMNHDKVDIVFMLCTTLQNISRMPGTVSLMMYAALLRLTTCQVKLVPEVKTEEGLVSGRHRKSGNGREFMAFEGIPFAEKPERFKLARPKQRWEGVLDAKEPGSVCAQQLPGEIGELVGIMGTEDCLFVNVHTPQLNEETLIPVMVWIHGGAFMFGSGSGYGPEYFMNEDIVLVTFNYRLGVFGFLYFEDELIPGNLGMKDQVLALKWVQRNIHHFGGDPKQVTIFGESAGGASVHFQILSSMSRGLFQRAIAQSGSAFHPWSVNPYPRWFAFKFVDQVSCNASSSQETLKCLTNAPFEDLVTAQMDMQWGPIPKNHISPVIEVDQSMESENAFLARYPKEIYMRGEVGSPVPLIMGMMKNEGVFIFSWVIMDEPKLIQDMNQNWTAIAPLTFLFFNKLNYTPNIISAADKIRKYYFDDHPVSTGTEQRLTDLFSDRYFIHGIIHSMMAHSQYAPVYPYLFTFYDTFSFLKLLQYDQFTPPTHADDLAYLFPTSFKPSLENNAEKQFSANLVRMWATFATTGQPKLWGPAEYWPTVNWTSPAITLLQLDSRTQLLKNPFCGRVRFWDDLLSNELQGIH